MVEGVEFAAFVICGILLWSEPGVGKYTRLTQQNR